VLLVGLGCMTLVTHACTLRPGVLYACSARQRARARSLAIEAEALRVTTRYLVSGLATQRLARADGNPQSVGRLAVSVAG
jgi:hypothetical protein